MINSLNNQLESINHSHFRYLERKIDHLIKILNRFAKLENVAPHFNQLFRKCFIDTGENDTTTLLTFPHQTLIDFELF